MLCPPIHYGMTVLNREAFKKSISVLALRTPAKKVKQIQKSMSPEMLDLPRMRNTLSDPDSKETRLLLLKQGLKGMSVEAMSHTSTIHIPVTLSFSIGEDVRNLTPQSKKLIDDEGLVVVEHIINLDYSSWSTEQILHAVIPDTIKEIPSAFTQVGHIAQMNLREALHPWKHLIGQVILDKNKNITSVVNKLSNIEATFRYFQMEVLAGDTNMVTEVKESGCRFQFDFSKVYWNSRLHTEHERLVKSFEKNQLVCDVFAGVGPFAIPAAKNGVTVYANDLNPESYQWLKANKTLNKISDTKMKPYNLDGREFIRQAVKDLESTGSSDKDGWKTFDHFVMNLPDTAIGFLDAFRGLYRDKRRLYDSLDPPPKLPMIHCHCFTKSDNPAQDIAKRVEQVIGSPYDPSSSKLHWVRNVAPKKEMYCISFPLTPEMIFGPKIVGKRTQDQAGSTFSPTPTEQVKKPTI